MADEQTWAERLAARVAQAPAEPGAQSGSAPERPAWVRAAVDRIEGRDPDTETMAEARRASRPSRPAWAVTAAERVAPDHWQPKGGQQDDAPPAA